MLRRFTIAAGICAALTISVTAGVNAGTVPTAGESVKPMLRRLLANAEGLSKNDRALYAYVIDNYLPECPGRRFAFVRLEEAIKLEYPSDGTIIVHTLVACDDAKNEPDKMYVGEYLRLNADFSLRARLDNYRPTSDLAEKIAAQLKELEEQERNPSPEPTEDEMRKKQTDALLMLAKKEKDISKIERAIYEHVITRHLPTCPELDYGSFHDLRDAVWLRKFNEGYLAISMIVCDWKDVDAFLFDFRGQFQSRFTLPAGKYGLNPAYELNVGDYTGDGQMELYYRKVFPTSSVPAFSARAQLYKVKPKEKKPRLILDMEVEEQDCFEASRDERNIGSRKAALLKFIPEKGVIEVLEEESEINCNDFSWGEKPIQPVKITARHHKALCWDPSRFAFVPIPSKESATKP